MNDAYPSIYDCNSKKGKIVVVLDNMIADMIINK